MNKQELIEEYLKQPIKVGDTVEIKGLGRQDKSQWGNIAKVTAVLLDDSIKIKDSSDIFTKSDWRKWTHLIGANPFSKYDFEQNIRYIAFNLESILCQLRVIDGLKEPRVNWNPTVVDKEGNIIEYQRDFCWTTEQNQALIGSIYKRTHIGAILVRKRWDDAKNDLVFDIVDGKQRLNAIIQFYNNVYPDSQGNYFRDFSGRAQRDFEDFSKLSFGEIGEGITDQQVIEIFLNINTAGVKMDESHLEKVKLISEKL
ncbi:MAG: DUF262 domain-containing protein [Bacteroidales bacterium]|jgi:hypothetical protein